MSADLPPDDEALLQTYIEHISQFQSQQSLTTEALQTIAIELGITESTLGHIRQTAQAHLTRAQGYVHHQLWDEAIGAASEALKLEPLWPQACLTLAQGYAGRFRQYGSRSDRQQARDWSKRCLTLQPDCPEAFALLQQLKQTMSRVRVWSWALVGAVLCGVGLGAFYLLAAPRPAPISPSSHYQRPLTPGEFQIPVQWPEQAPLKWQPHLSQLNVYSDSSYYKVQGLLKNQLNQEIHALTLSLKLFSAQGRLLHHWPTLKALEPHQPPLRPGDVLELDQIASHIPDVRRAQLEIIHLRSEPAPRRYEPSKVLPLQWSVAKPAHLNVAVRERNSRLHPTLFRKEQRTHDLVLELYNSGESTLSSVKLQVKGLSQTGQPVPFYELDGQTTLTEYVYPVQNVPLRPGEQRVCRIILYVPPEYVRYTLSVIDFK